MKQFELNIQNRESRGSSIARRLRAEGRIPACIYSKGNSRSISLSAVEFRDLKRSISGAALIKLTDEKGEVALTSIQDVQRNIIRNTISHIDFYEVEQGQAFVTQVPVHLVGEDDSIGVRNEGGIIDHKTHNVDIRCLPSKLPDHVTADVTHLSVGDALHVRELPAIEGVEYLNTPEQVIVSCQAPAAAVEEPAAEEESVDASEVPASKVKSDEASAEETA